MYNFSHSTKLDVSPHSAYYALIVEDEEMERTPVLIVVDSSKDNCTIVSDKKEYENNRSISAVILPHQDYITFELCKAILDTPYPRMRVVEVPLVAKHKGGLHAISTTIRKYH